ncbi:hypothetical protein [Corynebacterium glutamicum]|nr:hypothetical protein [Corynebacterium glutamicum]GFK20508.1 hypothetical protein KbCgl_30800 [Corynebacterium glutamicum]
MDDGAGDAAVDVGVSDIDVVKPGADFVGVEGLESAGDPKSLPFGIRWLH